MQARTTSTQTTPRGGWLITLEGRRTEGSLFLLRFLVQRTTTAKYKSLLTGNIRMAYDIQRKQQPRSGSWKARFDSPFDATDKAVIETLYFEVTPKRFIPTTCQQCYHDALIEIYLKLKKKKAMPKTCKYAMKAGFIISCPDFYMVRFPLMREHDKQGGARISDKYPHGELLPEDTQRGTHRETNNSQQAATRKKTSTKPRKQARKKSKTTSKTTQTI